MLNTAYTNDIRQALDHFRRSVDQLFGDYNTSPENARGGETACEWNFRPLLETGWTDSALHLRCILPGVSEKDMKVSLQGNQLVIEGERKVPEGFQNGYTRLPYGKFYTAVDLPSGLDFDQLSCRLHDGVLDIEVPVAEAMKPRDVPISTGEGRRSITG